MSGTSIHFGHNCVHYRHTDRRCTLAIERLKSSEYKWLHKDKWVNIKAAARSLEVSTEDIKRRILAGELDSRKKADGKDEVCIDEAHAYEVCPLSDAGGQCISFQENGSAQIKCLAELSANRRSR